MMNSSFFKTSTGDEIYINNKTLVVNFNNSYSALSSGFLNGGFSKDIKAIFNHQLIQDDLNSLKLIDMEDYLIKLALKLNLNYNKSTGIVTSANIRNFSIKTLKFESIEVTAIVTAGVTINASRAGDQASYYEENSEFKFGTINILLVINGFLNENVLVEALITATEAKSALMSDLRISSLYSDKFATGTGTDGVIIASCQNSNLKFNNAGKHSKLGELIAISVKLAIEESLLKENFISRTSQCDVLIRLNKLKFDINEFYNSITYDKSLFINDLISVKNKIDNVAITSSILNLIEEADNKLISFNVAYKLSKEIINHSNDYTIIELLNFIIDKFLLIK